MNVFIIIGVILCLLIIGDYVLRRKLKVLKHEKMDPRPKRIENIGVTILFIGYMIISTTLIFKYDDVNILLIMFPFFIVLSSFRAFMEWRFNRQARKWAMEIYSLSVLSIFIIFLLVAGDRVFG
ncbi:DUF4181 domain-containing protein [Sporosarcina sp. ACRSM]|uniref:DUF4181 domain-containing protein n=1 Tax=Sporosarcina sp. ACRSM TaxID=2918216 RepID=UPI001EF692E9|nr:DUF4181 domain-containing protein [Sporosarcina sp. ACRSM]MCG7335617.1 DUF4181 domain-containing protein [Sporosarcina sp. ACRSM]